MYLRHTYKNNHFAFIEIGKTITKDLVYKTFSCRPVPYFGKIYITIFWDENLPLFTFLAGKLRKNLLRSLFTYYHNKFSSHNNV